MAGRLEAWIQRITFLQLFDDENRQRRRRRWRCGDAILQTFNCFVDKQSAYIDGDKLNAFWKPIEKFGIKRTENKNAVCG